MFTKHVGGETVPGGVYWSMKAGEFIAVPNEGGKLEGGAGHQYIKAPMPVVLIAGPILGLAFAIFLPLSGLLVLLPFLGSKLRDAFSSGQVAAAHVASSRMQPGMSYLEAGSKEKDGAEGAQSDFEAEEDDRLVGLAEEIAEKRWQGK